MVEYGFDVETTGLDPYHGDRIFCWSLTTDRGSRFYLKNPANLQHLKSVLNNPNNIVVGQNIKYDLKMLVFEGFDVFNLKAKIHDTLLLGKVLNSVDYRHDLRHMARKYLHVDCTDKDEIEEWLKAHKRELVKKLGREPNFSDAPLSTVKKRVCWDASTTLKLYQFLYPLVMKVCPELYETERQLLWVVLDMEHRGITVDITRAKELRQEALIHIEKIGKKLNKLVCPLIVHYKRKGKLVSEIIKDFNPGSGTRQLPAAFYKLGIKLRHKTDKGNWCFDECALISYLSGPLANMMDESSKEGWRPAKFLATLRKIVRVNKIDQVELLPALVIKYRELSKLVSTYYNHFIEDAVNKHITPAGREYGILHCKFNQADPVTGRLSSSKPNLQNVPRKLGPRECFVPRKGCRFWLPDYAQVEMRFYIHFAKDDKMASRLSSDLHRQTAADMYRKPPEQITKEERERAGTVNFAIIYGAGADTLAATLTKKGSPTTPTQAARMKARYYSIYPLVPRTARELGRQLARQRYLVNPYGRRYYIPLEERYKALNYLCQGTSADLIKRAMVAIWLWLRAQGCKTRLLLTVHDELVFEVPYCETRVVILPIVKMMEEPKKFYVPITVGLDVTATRWSEKKGVELEDVSKFF